MKDFESVCSGDAASQSALEPVVGVQESPQRSLQQHWTKEVVDDVKMWAWRVAAAVAGAAVLVVKAVVMVVVEVFLLVVPREEKAMRGEIVVVTGAGQNLGQELALQISRLGAKLVLIDINEENNLLTAAMVREEGGEVWAYVCDVSNEESVATVAAKVRCEVGHPSYVFCSAGIYQHKPFFSHTTQDTRRLIEVNLLGTMWVCREFLGHMVQHNKGHVVCVSSVLGCVGRHYTVQYCASKFGVKGFTEALAEEMRMERRSGVRVTAVHPFLLSNVTDVSINIKFPWLFQVLSVKDAAQRIIKGVRRNEEEIFIPEKLKPFIALSRVLPRKLRRLFADYMET